MHPVCIRRARREDAARLTEIAHAAKRHWGYPDELMRLWRADLTVTGDFVDAHATHCAVAGTDVVGFYAVSRDGERFELEHLWVDPRRLRGGIGARLLAHAGETVRALGGARLRIASDPNAEGFYRRMGARRVGQAPSTPAGRVLPLLILDVVNP